MARGRPTRAELAYSATKACADLIARAYAVSFGLNFSVTRCLNNYGPYRFPEKLISLFVTNLSDGRHLPLYGRGENVSDWLWVCDHCRARLPWSRRKGCAASSTTSRRPEAQQSRADPVAARRNRAGLVLRRLSPRLARRGSRPALLRGLLEDRGLGYQPKTPVDQRLAITVEWFRENRSWWLREAGMALEAVQAQAGHPSIESTRVYLHLTNDWWPRSIGARQR